MYETICTSTLTSGQFQPSAYPIVLGRSFEPHTYFQASKDPKWVEAVAKELQALKDNHTWTLTQLSQAKSPIRNKWVYRIKYNANGSLDKFKARLVAKGYNQKEGVNYKETYAPVAKMVTIRTLLAISVSQGWYIEQLNINNAFLHAQSVGIKSLLNVVRITAAQVYVNNALMKSFAKRHGSRFCTHAASKVPMLKPGEYEIWRIRIEQYIHMIDYALWEVIENVATLPKTTTVEGVMIEMPITIAEEKAQRRLEVAFGFRLSTHSLDSYYRHYSLRSMSNAPGLIIPLQPYLGVLHICLKNKHSSISGFATSGASIAEVRKEVNVASLYDSHETSGLLYWYHYQ
ncbi:putative RNA-directed DNA polymerase [Tanacetum coccineum]